MIVMEFCGGGDLRSRLSSLGGGDLLLWARGGRRLMLDIAAGLAFLHSRKIIHFDLKSSNVMLSESNRAKIAGVLLVRSSRIHSASGSAGWSGQPVKYIHQEVLPARGGGSAELDSHRGCDSAMSQRSVVQTWGWPLCSATRTTSLSWPTPAPLLMLVSR